MPDYTIRDPTSGRTVKIRGESPPSEDELTEIFKALPAESPPPAQQPTATPPTRIDRAVGTAENLAIGAAKGAGSTISALGTLARKIPGVSALDRLMTPIPINTEATGIAQNIGKGAEQIAEFFVPGMGAGGRAAQAAKAAGLTYVQSGSPTAAGISAGLTAALPGASAAERAAQALQGSAERTVAQALGATKEVMKAEAQKLAPQILERGVKGSREAILGQAQTQTRALGTQLDAAYQAATKAGGTVDGNVIRSALQLTREGLQTKGAGGASLLVPGTERVAQQLQNLDEFVSKLGPDIPIDQAAKLKKTWDHIVSQAGLYGQKAGATATDSADAFAFREAASSFRELLNANPTIGALNKELAFWTGLKKVLTATQLRTQAQSGGLVANLAGIAGAAAGGSAGFVTGGGPGLAGGAVAGEMAMQQLTKLVQSPAFKTTVSAPTKQFLADALASGDAGRILGAVSRATAALPSQALRPSAPQSP